MLQFIKWVRSMFASRSEAKRHAAQKDLGRKTEQFQWPPRPEGTEEANMAKKQPKVEGENVTQEAPQAAPTGNGEAPKEKAAPAVSRGPKGVPETAKITVKAAQNPKRVGSRAHKLWTLYKDGMTVKEYVEACIGAGISDQATPALVYDSAHAFIEIEGYNPTLVQPKPRKEKKPKEPKADKTEGGQVGDPTVTSAPIKGDAPQTQTEVAA